MNTYPINPLAVGQASFNPYYTPMQNPVVPSYQVVQPPAPRMEIQRVNGKESAYAYAIGPNSSVVLVDNLEPKIWVVTTDSSGFKAVNGFRIIPDNEEIPQQTQQETIVAETPKTEDDPIIKNMAERLNKLEERMNAYGQSNTRTAGTSKPGNGNAQPNDRNGQSSKGPNGNN